MVPYSRFFVALLVATLFIYQCSAQLGTTITYPLSNDTISPGQKIDITYQYQNMGNGTYTVDIDLWQDNAASLLDENVATNVSVQSGNSAGTNVAFYLNATYGWTVPHGLNSTVYLTVTTKPQLVNQGLDLSMRSRPIMLHVNAGIMNMPLHKVGLFALTLGVLCFIGF